MVAMLDMVDTEPSAGATNPPAKTCVGENMGIDKKPYKNDDEIN